MSVLDRVRVHLRAMLLALRVLPDYTARSLNSWVMNLHQPIELFDDEGSEIVCQMCRNFTPWPCAKYEDASRGYDEANDAVEETIRRSVGPVK